MGRRKKEVLEKNEKELKKITKEIQPITIEKIEIIELNKEQKEKLEKLKKIMNEQNRNAKKSVLKFAIDELPVERIPFGLQTLDKIVGGGLPSKRFNVIWGPKGAGKCVDGETLIITKNGLEKIKDLGFEKDGFTDKNIELITPLGVLKTSHIFREKVNKYIEITLFDGRKLIGTFDHPILTKRGFVSLKKLNKTDEIFSVAGMFKLVNIKNKKINFVKPYSKYVSKENRFYNFPKYMTKDLAFILGYHLGDGNHNDENFIITFGDKQKMNSFIGRLKRVFGKNLKYNFLKSKKSNCYRFCTQKVIRDFFLFLGHKIDKIENLEIPTIIFNSPPEIIGSFIYGLLSADGYIRKRGISITLKSEKVIVQLQHILLYLGIRSFIRYKYSKKYGKYTSLSILNKTEINKLSNIIFGSSRIANKGFAKKWRSFMIPHQGLQPHQIDFFNFTEKIISKNIIEKELYVYDVTVPNLPIFIGNSIINHNTTLAYMAIAQAQKMGKLCAFIDLERSFEETRAKQFGVDTSNLVLANVFSNAEQAMDSLITMCRNQVIDFIVLDSIQALSPIGEQETKKGKEKSIADDDMALLARKLSKFFRVSASGVYESNVSILLIGQARTNLGGFIAFDSLSGGHALSHWASFIINSRRGSKADAPTEKIDTGEVDDKDKKILIEQQIGFNAIITLEKTKITSSIEGTKVNIPFYFQEGFKEVKN